MLEQIKGAVLSDLDLVQYQTGLDISTGTVIAQHDIRGQVEITPVGRLELRDANLINRGTSG